MDGHPRGHALRKGRYSCPGQIYLVTTVTVEREPVFGDLWAARSVVRALMSEAQQQTAKTLAYVIMPDHLHWLLELGEPDSLSRVMRRVKAVSAHRVGRPIWQKGFHDRALRREEDLAGAARYIVANPLRAGLVRHVGDYPHWDAVWLSP
ncbi:MULTISPECIES: transposase [unclassified Thioalkalivibrio]|uniref:REP-associated tyrosine transposase n=1 Tax=unclassified Thioalkalivibrio TaxID=2621013 RepID=UPI00035C9D59|nr:MULTISPECIES: transposase [unclassified Thioalkalivibrio]